MCSHRIAVSKRLTWLDTGDCLDNLQLGAQQEAGTFYIHVLPTGSLHGRATGLGAEACIGKGAPRTLALFSPNPSLLWSQPLLTLLWPRELTNNLERLIEATRDRPRDMFTACGEAEREGTCGHTHKHTLIWGKNLGWRLRRGHSGVGELRALIPGSNHSLCSEMG